ncbi:hydroxyethylthiazole kinase, partial [Eubacterium callanderi]|uniref:hydroxyethylthiazole kinase n=1 Tax=Eubacterium callanderi TaxID=53442 RepID=UPI003F73A97E
MDLIADAGKAYVVKNGHQDMSKITGTGCMLSAMTAAYVAANPEKALEAVVCAVASMGIAGELASCQVTNNQLGTGSLRTFIIDNISTMTGKTIETYAKIT